MKTFQKGSFKGFQVKLPNSDLIHVLQHSVPSLRHGSPIADSLHRDIRQPYYFFIILLF